LSRLRYGYALSRQFRRGFLWELLYADDLVISSDDLNDLVERFKIWKRSLDSKVFVEMLITFHRERILT